MRICNANVHRGTTRENPLVPNRSREILGREKQFAGKCPLIINNSRGNYRPLHTLRRYFVTPSIAVVLQPSHLGVPISYRRFQTFFPTCLLVRLSQYASSLLPSFTKTCLPIRVDRPTFAPNHAHLCPAAHSSWCIRRTTARIKRHISTQHGKITH